MKWKIKKYKAGEYELWNRVVSLSETGIFQFHRDYMDYHADRFTDFSLMFYYGEELFGILPAHIRDNTLFSHNGLSFGGIIRKRTFNPEKNLSFLHALLNFLARNHIRKFIVKSPPAFLYPWLNTYNDWLYLQAGRIERIQFHWLIDTRKPPSILLNADRKKQFKKKPVPQTGLSEDWYTFWQILEQNLQERHHTQPVHRVDEIIKLAESFPDQIRLITAKIDGKTVAGAVLYDYRHVLHFQYLAALPEKKYRHAVDFLTAKIIRDNYEKYAYINLGTARIPGQNNEDPGLIYWKFSHGAEPFPQYTFVIDTEKSNTKT